MKKIILAVIIIVTIVISVFILRNMIVQGDVNPCRLLSTLMLGGSLAIAVKFNFKIEIIMGLIVFYLGSIVFLFGIYTGILCIFDYHVKLIVGTIFSLIVGGIFSSLGLLMWKEGKDI